MDSLYFSYKILQDFQINLQSYAVFSENLQESRCFRLQTSFTRFVVEYINGNKTKLILLDGRKYENSG